jgi:hypothetical protein
MIVHKFEGESRVKSDMARSGSILATLTAVAVIAAAAPSPFGESRPGLWELSGIEGKKTPVRLCVSDLGDLARIEHRGRACKQAVLKQAESSITYNYNCTASDFGRSKMDWVTTNNIRIETQGISGGLPFGYTVQARRLGDCEPKAAPAGQGR